MSRSPAAAAARQSARTSATGLLGALSSGTFGFLLAIVITRSFGADGAGALFVVIGVLSIAMVVCCLGADTALVWGLPRRTSGRDAAALIPVAVIPAVGAALLVAAVGLVAAPSLAAVVLTDSSTDGVHLLRVTFTAVPVATLALLMLAAVRGLRPIGSYVAVNMVAVPAARPLLIGAVAVSGGGLVLGLAMWVVPLALAVLVCLLLLVRSLGEDARVMARPAPAQWRKLWGFALPRAGSAAVDASSVWISVLLVAALAGQAEAGVLGAVGRYVLAGLLVMQGLRVAVAPQLSRLLGAGRLDEAAAVHHQATMWVVVLSWPLFILLAVFGPGFLSLFGPEFVTGSAALAILACAMLVSTGLGNVQTLLLMGGRSGQHLGAVTAGLCTNVTLAVLLIPRWGLDGAATAWAAGIVVENVTAAVFASRVLRRPLLTAPLLMTGLAAAACALVPALIAAAAVGRGASGLVVAAAMLVGAALMSLSMRTVRRKVRKVVDSVRPAAGDREGKVPT